MTLRDERAIGDLARAIYTYLRENIAERGGTGRRPSTIELEGVGWYDNGGEGYPELAAAINELRAAGLVRFEDSMLGFYVVPIDEGGRPYGAS